MLRGLHFVLSPRGLDVLRTQRIIFPQNVMTLSVINKSTDARKTVRDLLMGSSQWMITRMDGWMNE